MWLLCMCSSLIMEACTQSVKAELVKARDKPGKVRKRLCCHLNLFKDEN